MLSCRKRSKEIPWTVFFVYETYLNRFSFFCCGFVVLWNELFKEERRKTRNAIQTVY